MRTNILLSLLTAIFLALGCSDIPTKVVTAETEPPHWHPGIVIEKSSLPVETEKARIKFVNADIELTLYPTGSGEWRADLDEIQLHQLLGGDQKRTQPARILFQKRSSKGYARYESMNVDIVVKASPHLVQNSWLRR